MTELLQLPGDRSATRRWLRVAGLGGAADGGAAAAAAAALFGAEEEDEGAAAAAADGWVYDAKVVNGRLQQLVEPAGSKERSGVLVKSRSARAGPAGADEDGVLDLTRPKEAKEWAGALEGLNPSQRGAVEGALAGPSRLALLQGPVSDQRDEIASRSDRVASSLECRDDSPVLNPSARNRQDKDDRRVARLPRPGLRLPAQRGHLGGGRRQEVPEQDGRRGGSSGAGRSADQPGGRDQRDEIAGRLDRGLHHLFQCREDRTVHMC